MRRNFFGAADTGALLKSAMISFIERAQCVQQQRRGFPPALSFPHRTVEEYSPVAVVFKDAVEKPPVLFDGVAVFDKERIAANASSPCRLARIPGIYPVRLSPS